MLGAPLLKANFPRAWLDVNREPYELDPKMFAGALPTYANVRSVRVAGGLGTIARIVSEREEIYARPLAVEPALARIDLVYKPYHRTLRQLVAETRAAFGLAVLIDCHSMPSTVRGGYGRPRPDIVLGDRYGTSCAPELTDLAAQILGRLRLCASPATSPMPAASSPSTTASRRAAMHAMQIEVNRSLYMDERTLDDPCRLRAALGRPRPPRARARAPPSRRASCRGRRQRNSLHDGLCGCRTRKRAARLREAAQV